MRARQFWLAPFWNAEGGGAGAAGGSVPAGGGSQGASGGGGGGSPDLVRAAAENPPPGGQTPPGGGATAYWPEGLPETFAGFKGASDRETINKLSGHLRDQPRAPEKPDGYKLQLSPDFVKRYGDLASDEVVPIWRQIAHKNGLTETQFNGAISELYSELSSKGLIDEPIDVGAEFEKLMPKHGDPVSRKAHASARINGVANTITGLVNRQVLTKTEGNMVLSLAARSEGVIVLEKLFKTLGEHGLQGGGDPGGQQQSEHERAMRSMFPSMHKGA